MKPARLLVALALLGVTLAAQAPAPAYHRWVTYHWSRSTNPKTLTYRTVLNSGSIGLNNNWSTLIWSVIGKWNNVAQYKPGSFDVFNFTQVTSGGNFTIESKNFGNNGWLGLAEVSISDDDLVSGHISSAKVKVNDYYFTGDYANNVAREHVLCQEVGHILGLEHNNLWPVLGKSCMSDLEFWINDPGFISPNAHDAEQLNQIYTHRDPGLLGLGVPVPVRTVVVHVTPA